MQNEKRKQLNASIFFDYAVSKGGLSKHSYFSCKILRIKGKDDGEPRDTGEPTNTGEKNKAEDITGDIKCKGFSLKKLNFKTHLNKANLNKTHLNKTQLNKTHSNRTRPNFKNINKIKEGKILKSIKLRLSSLSKKQILLFIIVGILVFAMELIIAHKIGSNNIEEYKRASKAYKMMSKTAPKALNDFGSQAKEVGIAYIDKKEAEEAKRKEEEEIKAKAAKSIINPNWRGLPLSASRGAQEGPSGKETYYNLDMSSVVSIMRGMGYDEANYPYHIREDGAKMLGRFILVAANLNLRPRGTLVTTSMGIGIVADTGGFASRNPTQIDIATNW